MSDATGRRATAMIIAFVLTIVGTAAAKYSGGTGEPNDPYQLATVADLIALGWTPADCGKHFILTTDIDLDPNLPGRKVFNEAVIAPDIDDGEGFLGAIFNGVLDGNGHTIKHLTIKGDRNALGLFGILGPAAVIANLGLEAAEVNGGGLSVGILASWNNGCIISCYSTGTVSGDRYVGGLVGENMGCITTSHSAAVITGNRDVGGLVGLNEAGRIAISWNTGAVRGGSAVGGLVGTNWGEIATSYNTGTVTGVEGVGGLVGGNYARIAMSYSTGAVSGEYRVGGFAGNNFSGAVIASFWDVETSGQASSAGGTGLTTASMQNVVTFLDAGWDLVEEVCNGTCDYWQVMPGTYPRLRCDGSGGPQMPEGSGTAEQPYLIRSATDLGAVWFQPMAHYRLEESVDLSGIVWPAAVVPWFAGGLDGNGHVISNLRIQGAAYLGLFGQLGPGATISRLGLEAVDVNGTSGYVGSLAGKSYRGHITASSSSGKISGAYRDIGGLVGSNEEGTIATSYSTCSVSGNGYTGGLAGHNLGVTSSIIASYSTGEVSGGNPAGGLVAVNYGRITASYSTAPVTGIGRVGGLVGINVAGEIATSYSTGIITGTGYVGGLVGRNQWGATGSSFWDIQTSGQALSDGGAGKTTAEMQTASTFLAAGWDFVGETANGTEDIWWIEEGKDYPRLWWEAATE